MLRLLSIILVVGGMLIPNTVQANDSLVVADIVMQLGLAEGEYEYSSYGGRVDYLSIVDQDISSLPKEIGKLTGLVTLNLYNNKLTKLPDEIVDCTLLESLKVQNNLLIDLPEEFGLLSNLTTLLLSENRLLSLPASIVNIEQKHEVTRSESYGPVKCYEYLVHQGTSSQCLSSGQDTRYITTDENISFSIYGNYLCEYVERGFSWSSWVMELDSDEGKDQNCNQEETLNLVLASIGISIDAVEYSFSEDYPEVIQRIDMSQLGIKKIPKSISLFSGLEVLDLSHNELQELPETIGYLKKLDTLIVSNNNLNVLTPQIGRLTTLTGLDLSNNSLVALPYEIENITTLEFFDLSGNELHTLPESVKNIPPYTLYDHDELDLTQEPTCIEFGPEEVVGETVFQPCLTTGYPTITITDTTAKDFRIDNNKLCDYLNSDEPWAEWVAYIDPEGQDCSTPSTDELQEGLSDTDTDSGDSNTDPLEQQENSSKKSEEPGEGVSEGVASIQLHSKYRWGHTKVFNIQSSGLTELSVRSPEGARSYIVYSLHGEVLGSGNIKSELVSIFLSEYVPVCIIYFSKGF